MTPRRRATRAEAEVGKEIAALKAELNDTRNYAAEIALGVTHYPHSDKEPCVRCERDSLRATLERVRALPRLTQYGLDNRGNYINTMPYVLASDLDRALAPVGESGACSTCGGLRKLRPPYSEGDIERNHACPDCNTPTEAECGAAFHRAARKP